MSEPVWQGRDGVVCVRVGNAFVTGKVKAVATLSRKTSDEVVVSEPSQHTSLPSTSHPHETRQSS